MRKGLDNEKAEEWYKWILFLNETSGSETYRGLDNPSFNPISEDPDLAKDIKKLCNQVSKSEISVRHFYIYVLNYDCFDPELLGPEYSNILTEFNTLLTRKRPKMQD